MNFYKQTSSGGFCNESCSVCYLLGNRNQCPVCTCCSCFRQLLNLFFIWGGGCWRDHCLLLCVDLNHGSLRLWSTCPYLLRCDKSLIIVFLTAGVIYEILWSCCSFLVAGIHNSRTWFVQNYLPFALCIGSRLFIEHESKSTKYLSSGKQQAVPQSWTGSFFPPAFGTVII